MVRGEVADGTRVASSSGVHRVLARLCFRSGLAFGFCCSWFADGPSFSSGRSATHADGPPGLCGRSVFLGSLLLVLCVLSDGPWRRAGQSAGLARTVRDIRPDGPRGQCGRSAPPGRTVRPSWPDGPPEPVCFASRFDSSLPFSCFRVCFKESFLRLEVDP
jgi:hypothetical protein